MMAELATNMEDLEDGEIESEGEDAPEVHDEDKKEENVPVVEEELPPEKIEPQEFYYSKSGKKKKFKNKGGEKKDKSKKNRKYASPPTEDDFAGNIEKAIRKAMNKSDDGEAFPDEEIEDRRKHKKRKKNENKDGPGKKRKKHEYTDEMDESEMMCIRGASPVQKPMDSFQEDDRDSYASDSSHESRGHQHHRQQRHRPNQRERNNKNNKNERRRGGAHPMQDPDGLCLYYMQGKCHKGDDCIYSHDAQPPRKMELCKFYLMDCCAKRDKCLYMHADFPCKYYHTGLPCIYKDECKFAHGQPLTENLKNILLKHIESAPKEILGDFPRLHREGALQMIQNTQMKLAQQLYSGNSEGDDKGIPSLFDLNIPNPQGPDRNVPDSTLPVNNFEKQKVSPKVRQSRWQNDNMNQNFNTSQSNSADTTNVLNIKNLTGVLTPRQISDLTKMGIDNLDQLGQLTVLQLNSIGISLKQITEIQLNTMSIQKLGLINSNSEPQSQQFLGSTSVTKDLDLRVPPVVPITNNVSTPSDFPGQDVDMRFQPSVSVPASESSAGTARRDTQSNKDMIDIDQYTKDALKFVSKDKENIDISNETFENEKPIISNETKDVDHRVIPFSEDAPRIVQTTAEHNSGKKECDTDIRFLQPEPIFKNPEKRHRRSTTDDEDNNLLIDEKWYSSDEEKGSRKKSPASSPRPASLSPQAPAPHVIEPSTVLSRLGDLSKIDISEEVTKLLNTMKNNLHDNKTESNSEITNSPKSRDPRSRRSPEKVSEPIKITSKKPPRVSIYECVDGEPTDGRRRTDVDLRQTEYKMPAFGDTDLRQGTSGDIDFRLGLPFKPIPNYTPASEIDGSINSHPPIPYKLLPIDIPRPDYTDIRNSTAKSQALVDPRLRKVFRLSLDESNSDSEKSTTKPVATGPRVDPRRKPKEGNDGLIQESKPKSNALELQNILQNSNWYKDLSSTQKIFVNQHLAPVTQMIKQHQQDKMPGKKLDLSGIQNNSVLCSIFTNLGISLGENGEFTYLPKPKEALLKTPVNPFVHNSNMPLPPGGMDPGNMNLMNIPPMGMGGMNNMNVGPMHGFNQNLPDPRGGPTPGLLGIAPNIPHGFNNGKFNGPNNFGNMPFNGPGPMNDFNFMDGEQNFPRFPNRGGHRGRGNDRWNRGGSGRGNRDRKNFNNDRGGHWKNDRH
ncbi:hypothetical protein ABMA28_016847 [Loxostege sticticalis]